MACRIVTGVINAIWPTMSQGSQRATRQIVGMNMIREYVIGGAQHRISMANAFERQAFGCINTWYTQDAHRRTAA